MNQQPASRRVAAVREHHGAPQPPIQASGGMTVRSMARGTAEQMAFALSFLIGFAPETFGAILDAAEPCSGDLIGPDEAEPRCAGCGARIGIFLTHGLNWQHYRGDGTTAGDQEIFSPRHEPVISWRLLEDGLILT